MMSISEEAKKYFDLGMECLKNENFEEAINNFTKVIEIDPNFKYVYNYRGFSYGSLRKYEEAIKDYTKAIEINENYKEVYYNRGVNYGSLRKYEEAIKDYTKAIEIDENYKEAYYNRGVNYGSLGKYEEAIKDYTKAIEIDENYKEAYYSRGLNYNSLEKYEEALKDFTKVIEIDENYKYAYFYRGLVYININKYEEAIKDYTKAIEIDENYKEAYHNRGFSYSSIKNYKEALKDFTKAIEIDKNYKYAYLYRAFVYININDYEEAINNFVKVIENNKILSYQQEKEDNITNNKLKLKDDILDLIYDILEINEWNYLSDNESINLIKLICFCYELMQKIKVKPSKMNENNFVHYTKAITLQHLLKKDYTAKLRLNNAVYMNDPEEGQILKQIIHKLDENNDLVNLFEDNDDIKNYTYLTCFSPYEKRDTLPMWVHYGDSCKGVGLVFNKDFFDGIDLYKVQYVDIKNFDISQLEKKAKESEVKENEIKEDEVKEDEEKEKGVKKNLDDILKFLQDNKLIINDNKEFKTYVNIILNYISYLFKDKAYEYENEVRILNYRDYSSSDIKTVISESGIPKLYIDYNKCISNENCVEVIAGPKANYTEISAYSKYVGISKVSKSEIKYR